MESDKQKNLSDLLKDIAILLEYGAPKDELTKLDEVIAKYGADAIVLNVFYNFYSYLPEGLDDGIIKISRVANCHGAFLFCASTLFSHYLYLATRESAVLIGSFSDGLHDQEVCEFFGWQDDEQFKKAVGDPASLPEHVPVNESMELCPVCGTTDGEIHSFGCPVEVCPWCDGQLTNCECRFTKTGRDNFSRDSHLEELLDLLSKKGRVVFDAKEHRPSFLEDEDLDSRE